MLDSEVALQEVSQWNLQVQILSHIPKVLLIALRKGLIRKPL